VRGEIAHVTSFLEDAVDVRLVGEDGSERTTQDLDDGEAMKAVSIVCLLIKCRVWPIFLGHLFL
jgi:hypothetical protein